MITILAQVSPERSTQYSALASALAGPELKLSPLGRRLQRLRPLQLAGQSWLQFELPETPGPEDLRELGHLAMTCAYYEWYAELAGLPGPFLRPLETGNEPAMPLDLLHARRYRGKTNELLTRFLCNVARFSSGFAEQPWRELQVLDPLAGGGTTLFAALTLGAEVAGVERTAADVESTATFLEQYLREARIAYSLREERLRKLGHRWTFSIGKDPARRFILARGDTEQARELVASFKPHLVVTDLPYGIQHHAELADLLGRALPVWAELLRPGGALVFSWDATRFGREEMIGLVESLCGLAVQKQPPYDGLAHRVDRVIKRRDVLVARRDVVQTA